MTSPLVPNSSSAGSTPSSVYSVFLGASDAAFGSRTSYKSISCHPVIGKHALQMHTPYTSIPLCLSLPAREKVDTELSALHLVSGQCLRQRRKLSAGRVWKTANLCLCGPGALFCFSPIALSSRWCSPPIFAWETEVQRGYKLAHAMRPAS